jgi:hypothetical protein
VISNAGNAASHLQSSSLLAVQLLDHTTHCLRRTRTKGHPVILGPNLPAMFTRALAPAKPPEPPVLYKSRRIATTSNPRSLLFSFGIASNGRSA